MKLTCDGISETGAVRSKNEDAILIRACDEAALFLVADGIGGRAHGEIVSGMLRDAYAKWWANGFLPQKNTISFQDTIDSIKSVALRVNRDTVARYGEHSAGSTLVLMFLTAGKAVFLSAGDSRIYRARAFSFQQLTRDDTFENMAVKPEGYGPEANGRLVAAVGIHSNLEYTVTTGTVRKRDRFLLCSDGVYRFVSGERLRSILRLGGLVLPADRILYTLEEEIERNGAGDNYSMIFVRVV